MRARLHDEAGQAVTMLVIGAGAILLAVGAIVVDVGHAYLVQRKLQTVADAAALAAADALPSSSAATTTATTFGPGATGLNKLGDGTVVTQTATPWCVTSVDYCFGNTVGQAATNGQASGIVVTESAAVQTSFMKFFGIPSLTVHAKATACGTCGGSQPLDIELVLDRTGSMCTPNCDALQGAVAGVRAFLQLMNPNLDYVGLTVLPPAKSFSSWDGGWGSGSGSGGGGWGSWWTGGTWGGFDLGSLLSQFAGFWNPNPTGDHNPACDTPSSSSNYGYNSSSSAYAVVPIANDYEQNGALNDNSNLIRTIDCVQAGGSTDYANAIDAAKQALDAHAATNGQLGRSNVQKVIVMLSDGAANTGPNCGSSNSLYCTEPCHQGIYSSQSAQSDGAVVYTIGYGVDNPSDPGNVCENGNTSHNESPSITAETALQDIASKPGNFLGLDPDPSTLAAAFQQVGNEIAHGSTLVPDE
jgi:Putative Flp pilus-assembly TadE/G-like/von Willebrand factor type A domain